MLEYVVLKLARDTGLDRKTIKYRLCHCTDNIQHNAPILWVGSNIIPNDFLMANTSVLRLVITMNYLWALEVVNNYGCLETMNALSISIGHESGHINGDFRYKGKHKALVNWIVEVHNDFYGCALNASYQKNALISSCEYKYRYKKERNIEDDSKSATHPTWEQRIKYAEYGSFDEELFKMIAEDSNVTITKDIELLFDKIIDFYGEIHLR